MLLLIYTTKACELKPTLQWLQTQIDLIRPAADKLNVQIQTLDQENKRMRAELAESSEKGVCPDD